MQYVKIKEALVEQIEAGMLAPAQKLPAERKLAESFDTTRVTLREALSSLEAEGRIYREDRRGWFIAPMPLRYDPTQTLNFSSMAKRQNRVPRTELLEAKAMMATKKAAELLELPPFSDVFRIERVRYLEQRPVMFVTNFIRPEAFPNLLEQDLESASLTDIYRESYNTTYSRVRYRITITSLTGDIAQALRATQGASAIKVERVNYNQHGELVDCDIEYWRHDAISIESVAQINGGGEQS
ncbi:phosphonate utilization transcriptional regulator PhnR [Vibrio hippocampi]|uniref:Transcriptional regulator of 2-aminoethylphosphonate degradation operons n=1 Tax=Vibrio hippocampi TaxID=654686 RepID=A0ABM8ZPY0_9VIBR|nr:phosphonate utilization transcriptional regulator PhnR [Vibrio hippocampi]CAH0530251.1 Putative transcriptional regulator of 2-aminoethylphosphonate degradation operons [Vibrio hippocampi]